MKAMAMSTVSSSNINAIGYDANKKQLDIEFSSGEVYRYLEVPKSVYTMVKSAPSVGKAFAQYVKGGNFTSIKLSAFDIETATKQLKILLDNTREGTKLYVAVANTVKALGIVFP